MFAALLALVVVAQARPQVQLQNVKQSCALISSNGTLETTCAIKRDGDRSTTEMSAAIDQLLSWQSSIDLAVIDMQRRITVLEGTARANGANITANRVDLQQLSQDLDEVELTPGPKGERGTKGERGDVSGVNYGWSSNDKVDGGFSSVMEAAWSSCSALSGTCRIGASYQTQQLTCDSPRYRYGGKPCGDAASFPALPSATTDRGATTVVAAQTTADAALVRRSCKHVACCAGYFEDGDECKPYGGECANGVLASQADRVQENHCATCKAGYGLNPTTRACDQCVFGSTFSNASDANACQPLDTCATPATWTTGGEYEAVAPAADATTDRTCGTHGPACTASQWQKRAPSASEDRLCEGAGTCLNGDLIELQSRTQANHCGDCDDGYFLQNKQCHAYTCLAGQAGTGCKTCRPQEQRTGFNQCATCNDQHALSSSATCYMNCLTSNSDLTVTSSNSGNLGSSGNCHGNHCNECGSDGAGAFSGKRCMWGHPNGYDVSYTFCYPQQTTLTGIRADYDAGAQVCFEGTCSNWYASNGNTVSSGNIDLPSPVTAKCFSLTINSHHSTWNWMGHFRPKLASLACPAPTVDSCPMQSVTNTNDGKLSSSGGCHGSHCDECSSDGTSAFSGKRCMWGHPNGYDVSYTFCYAKEVTVTSIVGDYDAGATVCLEGTCSSCYASNGNSINQCQVNINKKARCFTLTIDSHHSTWNWMGNWRVTKSCD